MKPLLTFLQLDAFQLSLAVVIGLSILRILSEVLEWFCRRNGIDLRIYRERRERKELKANLQKLTDMFIEKEIDDMRWEILSFSSALSDGRNFGKEHFEHIISLHTKYETILEENHMENGLVTASMEVIEEIYKEKLRNGTF